jgi:hypothetical protein
MWFGLDRVIEFEYCVLSTWYLAPLSLTLIPPFDLEIPSRS